MSHPLLWLAGFLALDKMNQQSRQLRECNERLKRLEQGTPQITAENIEPPEPMSEFEIYAWICEILLFIATVVVLTIEGGSLILALFLVFLLSPILVFLFMIPAALGAVCMMIIFSIIGWFRKPKPEPLDWSERMD